MLAHLADWLNLILRWAHLVVGIGWIGTSFYFIALDLALRRREGMGEGVQGSAWEVHGGGFYHVEKYMVAPAHLPGDLIWFKWEAYLTWATGFALLAAQYYVNPRGYLIDPAILPLASYQAILISVASLAAGWFAYDRLCRSSLGDNAFVLGLMLFATLVAWSAVFTHVFSGRGAFIHIGALIGTIMAANVFAVIIPNQKIMTASLIAGDPPDPALGRIGKQRSVHNNYLTLPVLLFMVSNHYPMLYAHPQSWLIATLIILSGGLVRHFLNRHDAGDPLRRFAWTAPAAAAILFAVIVMTAPQRDDAATGPAVPDAEILALARTHCATCHAARPSHEGFAEAPKGLLLESVADLRLHADQVYAQAVSSNIMPLGNETGMTDEERRKLGAWLAGP